MPVLGHGQVYVMKYGHEFHTRWCGSVAAKWASAPRGLLVTMLADVGERTRCPECSRSAAAASSATRKASRHRGSAPDAPAPDASTPNLLIPLTVVGRAHGILYLGAPAGNRELLGNTAVEPATPLLVNGRRDGTVVRVDISRDQPLLVIQMDPRAIFRDGPYQVRLRPPLRRSATKPYAVELVEPAEPSA